MRGGHAKKDTGMYTGDGGISCKRTYAKKIFFTGLLQNRNKESQLFRQPKLSIPICPVQLKSASSIPELFVVF